MARIVKGGLIQCSNPINDESRSVAEIQEAAFEKHLPFIDQAPLYNQANFNYYWDETQAPGNRNRTVSRTFVPAFACPTDPFARKLRADSAPTSYALSAGPGAAWHLAGQHNPGMFSRESSVRIRDVIDGTSNTVLAAARQNNLADPV